MVALELILFFLQFNGNGNDNATSFMYSCHHLCILLHHSDFTFFTHASLVSFTLAMSKVPHQMVFGGLQSFVNGL